MFNNLVNYHDLLAPAGFLRRGRKASSAVLARLVLRREGRVKTAWARTENPPSNWWDLVPVRERWNRLVSGDPRVDYQEYVARTYLAGARNLTALALGCGTGRRELRWAALAPFSRIEAYDLSESRVRTANETARAQGLGEVVTYRAGDVFAIEMPAGRFDVVFGEQSLHHFSPLATLMGRIERWLKPGGWFVVNDFVGPSRFQWTERQLAVVNALLAELPERYKIQWGRSTVKPKLFRPSRLRMILRDPSEAVESSAILPLLRERFEIVETRAYGGNVLQLLLAGIAHHFADGSEEARRLLENAFAAEDELLARGEASDFLVAVCRKRRD